MSDILGIHPERAAFETIGVHMESQQMTGDVL
jgi:hypothetical protein